MQEQTSSCGSTLNGTDGKDGMFNNIPATWQSICIIAGSGSGELPIARPLHCTNISCREGFYCREDSPSCAPSCRSWMQSPRSTSIAIDFAVLLSECIGVISGVAILVIAGLRWRKVYAYIYIIYMYMLCACMLDTCSCILTA